MSSDIQVGIPVTLESLRRFAAEQFDMALVSREWLESLREPFLDDELDFALSRCARSLSAERAGALNRQTDLAQSGSARDALTEASRESFGAGQDTVSADRGDSTCPSATSAEKCADPHYKGK